MNKLLRLRSERQLTQEQVAKAVKITRSAYAMIESGARTPRPKTMQRLADFFGVTVDELFFEGIRHELQHDEQAAALDAS